MIQARCCAALWILASVAAAQVSSESRLRDDGLLQTLAASPGESPATVVRSEGASWVRVRLGAASLPGAPGVDGWTIRITSLLDGGVQHLDRERLAQWSHTSAYFNGDAVLVELVPHGSAQPATLEVVGLTAGEPPEHDDYGERSICGTADNRALSSDPAVARIMPSMCTGWLFNDANRTILSAGHCGVPEGSVAQFNVPLSDSGGALRHPSPRDQYPVDVTSVQSRAGTIGNDWAYFGCFPNSETGLTAYQAQGACLYLANTLPAPVGQGVRVTGFGSTNGPIPWTWNRVQKSHVGPFASVDGTIVYHAADTTGGNSGSPVIVEPDRTVIAIHTHGGCMTTGGANAGTSVLQPELRESMSLPRGVCASGVGTAYGPVWVAGDINNSFGQVDDLNGHFAARGTLSPGIRGLAFDSLRNRMIATNGLGKFWTIDQNSGVSADLGVLEESTGALSGLAFDPTTDRLFGIRASDGQLLYLDPATRKATPVGQAAGAGVGGIDADPRTGVVYGVMSVAGSVCLLRFEVNEGSWTKVGVLGAGAASCNALACLSDGRLYTIDVPTATLLRIDPETGAAFVIGPTGGMFTSSGGMCGSPGPACVMADFNADYMVDAFDLETLDLIIGGALTHPDSDVNGDHNLDGFDMEAFERRLGGDCS